MHELTEQQLKELEKVQYLTTEDLKSEKIREERRIIHWISTPDLDRGRDIMMPKGGIFDEFNKTKTVFADHNYDKPIGSNVKLIATNDGVKATTYFTDKTEFANDRYQLHIEGVLNNWSIGFSAYRDKSGRIEDDSIEFDDDKNIRVFNKWNLIEYSDTGIPMNTDCLDIAKNICKSYEMKSEIETLELRMLIAGIVKSNESPTKELQELKESLGAGYISSRDFKMEILKINLQLKQLVGNASTNNLDSKLLEKELKKAFAGAFNEVTGRKLKT